VPAIIYLFILPFAAIYTLVWAFLISLGIFPQANVNRILALIIAFLTIPMGWFTKMVWVLFGFLGGWSVAVFAATFIIGILFRGAGVATKEYAEYKKYIQMGKKGLGEVIKRLEEARKGTVGQMRQEARNAISAAPALNIGARALQNLEMAANPQTPENEVSKYIDEAIKELKKEL
jgi:type II secretory pathway component PulF